MVLDAADAGDVFREDMECPAFLLRSDDAPEMDDAVRDDKVRFAQSRPFLFAKFGEQSAADHAVRAFFIGHFGTAAGQYPQQVGAADYADDLTVVHDRDPFGPLG